MLKQQHKKKHEGIAITTPIRESQKLFNDIIQKPTQINILRNQPINIMVIFILLLSSTITYGFIVTRSQSLVIRTSKHLLLVYKNIF
jgi:hypothetical protein